MTQNDAYKFTFQVFLSFYRKHPQAENSLYYDHFPKANKDTIRSYKSRAKKIVSGDASPKQKVKKTSSAGSDNSSIKQGFLDDPDELLLSVAIRELNKKNPDPRWATILINCKKENINTKGDVLEQFKQLPTQVLVNLLSKNLQEESE